MAMDYPPLKNIRGFSWMGVNLGIKDESLDFGVIASAVSYTHLTLTKKA